MSEYVQRLLVEQDNLPVETDAPLEDASNTGPDYDVGLQAELLEWGPDALVQFGQIVVQTRGDVKRFNTALWYAMAFELHPEHKPEMGAVVITDPKGGK